MTEPLTPPPIIGALTDSGPTAPPRSHWRDVWDQFKHHRGALIGGVIFFTII
ncbi:Oligopeptide transport system permease protein OppC (TC 3.A.1.5.1), partial [hydrothermal vent metagenome]